MIDHICPWWGGYFLDNRLRYLLHKPKRILAPFVGRGMTTMDFGCGMGLFSIAMAEMVGENGTVIAADLQPRMLKTLRKRAEKSGLAARIRTHVCARNTIGIQDDIDFALAFWSAHEAPDLTRLMTEIHARLIPHGTMLLVEPRGHVTKRMFTEMLDTAERIGFQVASHPAVRLSRAAELVKQESTRQD